MAAEPLEPPPQARPRINGLALASQRLALVSGGTYAVWVVAAVAASLFEGGNLRDFLRELPTAFVSLGVMSAGIPIFLIFLASLAALVTGILARKQTTRREEDEESRRMASSGIRMATIELAILAVWAIIAACLSMWISAYMD
jgi:hypothetical protein